MNDLIINAINNGFLSAQAGIAASGISLAEGELSSIYSRSLINIYTLMALSLEPNGILY
jgi:hypothetical protein